MFARSASLKVNYYVILDGWNKEASVALSYHLQKSKLLKEGPGQGDIIMFWTILKWLWRELTAILISYVIGLAMSFLPAYKRVVFIDKKESLSYNHASKETVPLFWVPVFKC